MDRCALFVDAGHLLVEAGKLCLDSHGRREIECNFSPLLESLGRLAAEHSRLPLLRAYWYDAAPDGIPTAEQQEIAALSRVKVRLGRLVAGRQKGVDSLIVRDLICLARDRAVATMYLLSGDEDLREGVLAAQEMGVMVVVLGIPARKNQENQARSLIREADEHLVLEQSFWAPYFSNSPLQPSSNALEDKPELATGRDFESTNSHRIGQAFALAWAGRATPEELRALLGQRPEIPKQLDVRLLKHGEQALSLNLHERQDLKKGLRAGFWSGLTER